MPQVSLYLDKDTMRRVTRAARDERVSISRWVRERVVRETGPRWPASYEDQVLGSLRDETLDRPPPLKRAHNSKRAKL
jgi:hypothetical protein